VTWQLYAFSVLDVFLAYTIAGSLFSKLEQLSRLAGGEGKRDFKAIKQDAEEPLSFVYGQS
jgi:hypothetical protein